METKYINKLIFYFIFFISANIYASNDENPKSKIINNNSINIIQDKTLNHNLIRNSNPEMPYKIKADDLFEKYKFNYSNIYQLDTKSLKLVKKNITASAETKVTQLQKGEYISIKGIDNKLRFFNGSLIIKFNEMPDLESYALLNNLTYTSNLSDINSAVFKVQDISLLETTIRDIKLDENILNVELSLKDPSIQIR